MSFKYSSQVIHLEGSKHWKTENEYSVNLDERWFDAFIMAYKPNKLILHTFEDKFQSAFVGVVPLEIREIRGTRFWSHKKILPLATGPTDFFDFIVKSGKEKFVTDALCKWLYGHPFQWDHLILNLFPEKSQNWQPLFVSMRNYGFDPLVDKSHKYFFLDTSENWETYHQNHLLPRIKDLQKGIRRIESDNYQVSVERVTTNIERYLEEHYQFYAIRRDSKDQADSMEDQRKKDFLREVIQSFEKTNNVELWRLFDQNNDTWAYQLNWVYGGIRYLYSHSFNETFRRYSPGKYLLYRIIEDSFQDPDIRECNFMRGESSYKKIFANQSARYVSISLDNPRSIRLKLTRLATKLLDFYRRKRIKQNKSYHE